MKAWVKSKLVEFRKRRAVGMLTYIVKHAPQILTSFVNERASEVSLQTTMAYLEREGYMHCDFCPTRFGLQKVGKFRVCTAHKEHAEKIKAAAQGDK